MRIALVHDDFVQLGGAESLFATIASLFPQAPIYTSLIDWPKLPQSISRDRVRTSFLQKISFAAKFYKALLPLYPLAFESFNLDDFDLVISSTTRFAKSIITKPGTVHICYINSLPRFLWNKQIQKEYLPRPLYWSVKPILNWVKRWDQTSAARPDHYLANSQKVQENIRQYYGYDSDIIYPFADLNFFKPAKIHKWHLKSQNFLLIVSRLVKWKKIDIAIEAAKELGINLKIVGTGPDEARLKRLSTSVIPAFILTKEGKAGIQSKNSNSQILDQVENDNANKIEFLGRVTREKLRQLYQNTKALIVTQEEDFGIAACEAQACGKPVIAYSFGGQQEIVKNGKTGLFFTKQTPASLEDAIEIASRVKWRVSVIRKNAMRFSRNQFITRFKIFIKSKVKS